jgi:integral membrane protein
MRFLVESLKIINTIVVCKYFLKAVKIVWLFLNSEVLLHKINNMSKLLPTFRITALLEGLSYILLLFIATPIKYLGGDPQYVKMLGMPHGILFMAYVVMAVIISKDMKWSSRTLWIVLIASVIPFGTFYIDKKYLKK